MSVIEAAYGDISTWQPHLKLTLVGELHFSGRRLVPSISVKKWRLPCDNSILLALLLLVRKKEVKALIYEI